MESLVNDILFLKSKLRFLQSEIKEEYCKFVKEIVEIEKKNMKTKLLETDIKKINSIELKITSAFTGATAKNSLFYMLDTFLIDLKRCIEFTLRFIRHPINSIENDFGLEKFMNQILGNNGKNELSNFVKYLLEDHKTYVDYILSEEKWLSILNGRRTRSIHYEVFNQVKEFKIAFEWNSIQSFDDEPKITFPELSLFKREPILHFIENNLQKLDIFLNKSFSIRQDFFKDRGII